MSVRPEPPRPRPDGSALDPVSESVTCANAAPLVMVAAAPNAIAPPVTSVKNDRRPILPFFIMPEFLPTRPVHTVPTLGRVRHSVKSGAARPGGLPPGAEHLSRRHHAHLFSHHAIGPDRLDAFETPRAEGAAGFGAVLVDGAVGLAGLEVEMGAVAAAEIDEGAAALFKQAFGGQGVGSDTGLVFRQKNEIARMAAETAGSAGDAIIRRIRHVR